MRIPEQLQLSALYFSIERIDSNVSRYEVAEVVVREYASKGVTVSDEGVIEKALRLAALDRNDVGVLLQNDRIIWQRERWPIGLLRMTQMSPPENDPLNVCALLEQSGRRFKQFATILAEQRDDIIASDIGYIPQPLRDQLPVIGVRGRIHNHIVDGHHRTVRAIWEGRSSIECLTAYKR